MDIEIVAAESLGVRSLCCFVKTKNHRILIDPGIALGYTRYGLLPHPVQVAVDERIQRKIIERWSEATEIVISHFHGDHVPLKDANPYQLSLKRVIGLNQKIRILTKDLSHLTLVEKERARCLSLILKKDLISVNGEREGPMTFSELMPHGERNSRRAKVMMTRIEDGNDVFVHGSDIQLFDSEPISQILSWHPDVALVGGPPLYLPHFSKRQIEEAWQNAVKLSQGVDTLIIDHHLMRCQKGVTWLKRLSLKTGKRVICAADFMKKPRILLEARRKDLYKEMPVSKKWHENYAKGKVIPGPYLRLAKKLYKENFRSSLLSLL